MYIFWLFQFWAKSGVFGKEDVRIVLVISDLETDCGGKY